MATDVQRYAVRCPECGVVLFYTPFRTKAAFCPFCRHFFISGKHEKASDIETRDMPHCLSCFSSKKRYTYLEPLDEHSLKCPSCSRRYSYVKHELLIVPLPDEIYPFRVSRKLAAKLMGTWLMNNEDVPEDALVDFQPEFIDAVYIPVYVFEGEGRFRWQVDIPKGNRIVSKKNRGRDPFRITLQGCDNTPDCLNSLFCLAMEQKITDVKPLKDLDDFAHVPILSFNTDLDNIYDEKILPLLKDNFKRQAKTKAGCKPDADVKVNIESQIRKDAQKTYYVPFWIVTYRYHGALYKCGVDGFKGIYCNGDIPKKKLADENDEKRRKWFIWMSILFILAVLYFAVTGIVNGGLVDSIVMAKYLYIILPTTILMIWALMRFLPQMFAIFDSKRRRQVALADFLAIYNIAGIAELDYNVNEEKRLEKERNQA